MRIIRFKIDDDVKELLADISKQFGVVEAGFVEDCYALLRLKGYAIPTRARLKMMAQFCAAKYNMSEVGLSLVMNKRMIILRKLVTLTYFRALMTSYDPVDATSRLISYFRKLYSKIREASCLTCKLLNVCEYGKEYGKGITDIRYIYDPSYATKIHKDCPNLPDISIGAQVTEVFKHLEEIAKELNNQQKQQGTKSQKSYTPGTDDFQDLKEPIFDPSAQQEEDDETDPNTADAGAGNFPIASSVGKTHSFDATFDGKSVARVFESFADNLSKEDLMLYELGAKFSTLLGKSKHVNFEPVPYIDKTDRPDLIQNPNDITKLESSQHGLPDEVFDARLQKKQLIKKQDISQHTKKQLLYFLIDSSGSMDCQINSNRYNILSRGALASTMALAMSKKVQEDKGYVFCRFFEGSVSRLYEAKRHEDFEALYSMLVMASYNGGGTDILHAIQVAIEDIQKAGDELAKAEILVVTDCEDHFDASGVKKVLKGQELNILDVAGQSGSASKALASVATKYYKVNPSSLDLQKIVDLI